MSYTRIKMKMYLFFLNRDATKIIFYTVPVLKFTAYVVSVTELCMYVHIYYIHAESEICFRYIRISALEPRKHGDWCNILKKIY